MREVGIKMVKLALLGESFPSQLRENPQALRDVQVVWSGTSLEAFRNEVPAMRPDVLALDFMELNVMDTGVVPALLEDSRARHAIVTYRFARRGVLQGSDGPALTAMERATFCEDEHVAQAVREALPFLS